MKNLSKKLIGLAVIGAVILGAKSLMQPRLKYFTAFEFGRWWPFMSRNLLKKLDAFRERWGAPVAISGAEGAIGRTGSGDSQHNLTRWGEVRAVDIQPLGMSSSADFIRAVEIAKDVGFTGIGLYPNWNRPGLHLDVRNDRLPGSPATWSAYYDENGQQQYAALERGLG